MVSIFLGVERTRGEQMDISSIIVILALVFGVPIGMARLQSRWEISRQERPTHTRKRHAASSSNETVSADDAPRVVREG
jgi:hypothetical protein